MVADCAQKLSVEVGVMDGRVEGRWSLRRTSAKR